MRLIDADRILQHKRRLLGSDCWMGSEYTIAAVPVEVIDAAPIIDAEPVVHARWVMQYYSPDGDPAQGGEIVCSACGEDAPINRIEKQYESAHCPSCGAKMDTKEGNT